jgi:CheY-like chemotaxis protein
MEKTIFIFDDDADILTLCSILLHQKGFNVHTAANCTNIIDKINEAKPNAILMDNRIPEKGGIEATQLLKNNESTKHIPVIFFSANTNVEQLSRQAGADYFLQKPFDIDEMESLILRIT